MSAFKTLLDRLIDYAGLFPPAQLAMRPAVENYQRYLREPHRWMLGRFIVTASRLPEFESELNSLDHRSGDEAPWLISALISPANELEQLHADLAQIEQFNARQESLDRPLAIVDTVEGKASDETDMATIVTFVPRQFQTFVELPIGPGLESRLDALRSAQSVREVFAKIRTGGVVPEAIPAADRVAAFIAGCAARDLKFKATAGLHHPIRAEYRLTYQTQAPRAVMFGFLNVFVAACAAYEYPRDIERIKAILSETELAQFKFAGSAIGWQGISWTEQQVRVARQRAVAFGSCSFVEPVDDLLAAGLLS